MAIVKRENQNTGRICGRNTGDSPLKCLTKETQNNEFLRRICGTIAEERTPA